MATVQHKDIIDPNIHEPKGVKFAAEGTAYVANGLGSGTWIEVLTPAMTSIVPSAVYTFDSDIGSTEYSSGVLFPGTWVVSTSWEDVRVDRTPGFLKVNKTGIYLVSAAFSVDTDNLASIASITIAPTKTSSAFTSFQPSFFTSITAFSNEVISKPLVSGIAIKLTAGQGFGFWATVSAGVVKETRLTATVQMTRLSDG